MTEVFVCPILLSIIPYRKLPQPFLFNLSKKLFYLITGITQLIIKTSSFRGGSALHFSIAAMDSGTDFTTSHTPNLSEDAPGHTMTSATTGFEEDLAALRLDEIPQSFMYELCSNAEGGTYRDLDSAVAVGEHAIGLQPHSNANRIDVQRSQLQSSELSRFDSTSSMRSLMTDSIFSIGATTDSCPPSPSSSTHVAEPLHCRSFNLNSGHVRDLSRKANALRAFHTEGLKSSVYVNNFVTLESQTERSCACRSPYFSLAPPPNSEDGLSHSTSEYGSK